jgi:hypothetical protein
VLAPPAPLAVPGWPPHAKSRTGAVQSRAGIKERFDMVVPPK